jgi:trans-2,3-dihydro-3-hydroxyanthranilate isomerase
VKYGYLARDRIDIRVEEGYEIGRPSLLLAKAEDKGEGIEVSVGGRVVMVARGELV